MRSRPTLLVALTLAVAVATAACGGSTKVGNESQFKGIKNGQNAQLGQITTSTQPVATTARATSTTRPAATTRPTTAATVRTLAPVTIEEGESSFNPPNPRVRKGTTVNVVNKTSQTVNFTSGNGRWSHDIAAGGTYTFTADVVGNFTMGDDNRPFMTGTFEVVE